MDGYVGCKSSSTLFIGHGQSALGKTVVKG